MIITRYVFKQRSLSCAYSAVPLIFLLILITISCSSLSPVNQEIEKPVSFSTVETVQPIWQSFAHGVGFFHAKVASPRFEFWALRIDLDAVRIVISSGAVSAKVSGFVRDNNLIAGINAVPFDVVTAKEGEPLKNMGLVVSNYKVLAPANPNYDALVFFKDRDNTRAIIVNQADIYSTQNIENAAGGFHQILRNGEPMPRTAQTGKNTPSSQRHPRSAAGVSANGSILYLLVIDGRRSGSVGATEQETALLLRALGSTDGINFDGGGSSAIALRRADGSVRTVNTPIHGGIPGRERAVAACLGIADNK